jgi:hypothetical protein
MPIIGLVLDRPNNLLRVAAGHSSNYIACVESIIKKEPNLPYFLIDTLKPVKSETDRLIRFLRDHDYSEIEAIQLASQPLEAIIKLLEQYSKTGIIQ